MPGLPVHHQLPEFTQNSYPLSEECHPTISSSVVPFSSRLQSVQGSGSFPMSQLFTSGGQSIAVSASVSVLPMNIQGWFPLGLTGWTSLLSKDSQESSPTPQFKSINSSGLSFLYSPTLTSTLTTGKTIALTRWTFVGKVMSLLFNMLSVLVITFLPRSKHLLISWLQAPSAVILEPPKKNPVPHLDTYFCSLWVLSKEPVEEVLLLCPAVLFWIDLTSKASSTYYVERDIKMLPHR